MCEFLTLLLFYFFHFFIIWAFSQIISNTGSQATKLNGRTVFVYFSDFLKYKTSLKYFKTAIHLIHQDVRVFLTIYDRGSFKNTFWTKHQQIYNELTRIKSFNHRSQYTCVKDNKYRKNNKKNVIVGFRDQLLNIYMCVIRLQ